MTAESWHCPRCPFIYESPLELSAPPLHRCPSPKSSTLKPATVRHTPNQETPQ